MRNMLLTIASVITLGLGLVVGFGNSAQAIDLDETDFDDFRHSAQIYDSYTSMLAGKAL